MDAAHTKPAVEEAISAQAGLPTWFAAAGCLQLGAAIHDGLLAGLQGREHTHKGHIHKG